MMVKSESKKNRFINVKFIKSASKKAEFIDDELNQVAIVGRSNVGKSSLINLLTNNSKMAKTSGVLRLDSNSLAFKYSKYCGSL